MTAAPPGQRPQGSIGDERLSARPHPQFVAEALDRSSDAPPNNEVSKRASPYIVLVALDLSEPGGRAWRFAFDLAERRGEAEIHAVVTADPAFGAQAEDVPTPRASVGRNLEPTALPPLKVLQHQSAGGKARLMAMHFRTGRPHKAILKLAAEIGADLIVIPTQPTSRLQRLLGGSVADRIARNAPCPVVVVRPKQDEEDPGVLEFEPHVRR